MKGERTMKIEITYEFPSANCLMVRRSICVNSLAAAEEICQTIERKKGYRIVDVTRDVYED